MKCDDVLERINEQKKIIETARDNLRTIQVELETCLESFDRGIEGLEIGTAEIERAIDSLSEVI